MKVQDVLVSGDKAVARARATGTHQGEFLGMAATGKSVNVQLIDITGSAPMALPASTEASSTR